MRKKEVMIFGALALLLLFALALPFAFSDYLVNDTLQPVIIVNTSEPSTLYSYNLFNRVTMANVPIKNIENSSDNQSFKFKPENLLEESLYGFYVKFKDIPFKNPSESELDFRVNLSSIKFTLIEPTWGVASSSPFVLRIGLNREALECRYQKGSNATSFSSMQVKLDKNSDLEFGLPSIEPTSNLFVWCNDSYGRTGKNYAIFRLSVDTKAPGIVIAEARPSDINEILNGVAKTTIFVQTDEITRCRYSSSSDTAYESMKKFSDYDSGFTDKHSTDINVSSEKGTYNVYVVCEDKAPNYSTVTKVTYNVDLDAPLKITSYTKSFFSESQYPVLNITTNKIADCSYTRDKTLGYNGDFGVVGTRHTARLTTLGDGSYTYYIKCESVNDRDDIATADITFSIDKQPPVMLYVNSTSSNRKLYPEPDRTWKTDRLYSRWKAQDNVSGIAIYEYVIYQSNTIVASKVIANGTTSSEEEWVSDLNLTDGKTYYFKVRAKDNVGKWSEQMKGVPEVTVDVSLKPLHCENEDTDEDETDEDCGGEECDPCGVNKRCVLDSDCESKFCNGLFCAMPSCTDTKKNGDETDLNCGGSCNPCAGGKDCVEDADCVSGECGLDKTCTQIDSCSNDYTDNGETDLNCGGPCLGCDPGMRCKKDSDCSGTNPECKSNVCRDCTAGDLDCDGTQDCRDDDIDGDGLKNWEDPDDDNDGKPDTTDDDDDGDGVLDASDKDCDNDLDNDGIINENDDDIDGDGILNADDNDDDNDGIPDDLDDDDDNDGKLDVDEDYDGDGMPNGWEEKYGFDPDDPNDAMLDYDGDGLTNLEEYNKGTNPKSKDTDGDGYDDYTEIQKGTSPTDPDDHPKSPWLMIIILLLILIVLGVGGYFGYPYLMDLIDDMKRKSEQKKAKPKEQPRKDMIFPQGLQRGGPSSSQMQGRSQQRQVPPARIAAPIQRKPSLSSKEAARSRLFDAFSSGKTGDKSKESTAVKEDISPKKKEDLPEKQELKKEVKKDERPPFKGDVESSSEVDQWVPLDALRDYASWMLSQQPGKNKQAKQRLSDVFDKLSNTTDKEWQSQKGLRDDVINKLSKASGSSIDLDRLGAEHKKAKGNQKKVSSVFEKLSSETQKSKKR